MCTQPIKTHLHFHVLVSLFFSHSVQLCCVVSFTEKWCGSLNPLTENLNCHAMVDACHRHLPEQHARLPERMQVSCRIQANSTGPVALSVQRSVQDTNREWQHCHREHLNAERSISELVHSLPLFLPLHQNKALQDFLDRLYHF